MTAWRETGREGLCFHASRRPCKAQGGANGGTLPTAITPLQNFIDRNGSISLYFYHYCYLGITEFCTTLTAAFALPLIQVCPHMTETICSQIRTSRIVVDALTGVVNPFLFPLVPISCAPFLILKLLLTSRNNNTSERGVMEDALNLQRATNRSAVPAPRLLCLRSRQLHVSWLHLRCAITRNMGSLQTQKST